MSHLREIAKAKVNLSLRVLGRRGDGLHQLESLVAFAEIGDRLACEPGPAFGLDVEGRFAGDLEGRNLVARAAEYYGIEHPDDLSGAFRLEKRLPVAAGLGGGSADAAAALRLLARGNGNEPTTDNLAPLAKSLGADVSVCLESRPTMMWGVGERLEPVPAFPPIHAVLVTPQQKLSTPEVFAALAADPLDAGFEARPPDPLPDFETVEQVAAYAAEIGNDLQQAACSLAPEIAAVQQALRYTIGCHLVQLTGSGATSFGLYQDERHAVMAAANLSLNPDWWVAQTVIG